MLNFVYAEINPLVFTDDGLIVHSISPPRLTRLRPSSMLVSGVISTCLLPLVEKSIQRKLIRELDGKTGASLKLTILNHAGRIWTMVAGGGASVVYADTISDLGYGQELANYGEYSGAPSTEHTYEYAKTLISLMCKQKDPRGKIFIIGGGIANFTDVAATFTGLIKAIVSFQDDLKAHNVQIWVRRAGPNYQEGLQ